MDINSSLNFPFQVYLIVQERTLFNGHFGWHVIKCTSSLHVLNVLSLHTYTWSFISMDKLLSLLPFKSVKLEHVQERTRIFF